MGKDASNSNLEVIKTISAANDSLRQWYWMEINEKEDYVKRGIFPVIPHPRLSLIPSEIPTSRINQNRFISLPRISVFCTEGTQIYDFLKKQGILDSSFPEWYRKGYY